jgi:hypothetical protein
MRRNSRRQILPSLNEPASRSANTAAIPEWVQFERVSPGMKVGGSNGVGSAQGPSGLGAKPVAGGFSIASPDGAQETQASARLASTLGVGSIDALLALQEVGGPTERRRKAVRRAGIILDVLDDVKLAVLDGGIAPATLGRLIEAVRQERGRTGDTGLESLLDEIETRAEVEMAKLEQHAAAT